MFGGREYLPVIVLEVPPDLMIDSTTTSIEGGDRSSGAGLADTDSDDRPDMHWPIPVYVAPVP